jgi:hypothetical protein
MITKNKKVNSALKAGYYRLLSKGCKSKARLQGVELPLWKNKHLEKPLCYSFRGPNEFNLNQWLKRTT